MENGITPSRRHHKLYRLFWRASLEPSGGHECKTIPQRVRSRVAPRDCSPEAPTVTYSPFRACGYSYHGGHGVRLDSWLLSDRWAPAGEAQVITRRLRIGFEQSLAHGRPWGNFWRWLDRDADRVRRPGATAPWGQDAEKPLTSRSPLTRRCPAVSSPNE